MVKYLPGPGDDSLCQTDSLQILFLSNRFDNARIPCLNRISGKNNRFLHLRRNFDPSVFQPFTQFFQVVNISKREASRLIDRFERLFGGLLSQEALIFPECLFDFRLFGQGKTPFSPC